MGESTTASQLPALLRLRHLEFKAPFQLLDVSDTRPGLFIGLDRLSVDAAGGAVS